VFAKKFLFNEDGSEALASQASPCHLVCVPEGQNGGRWRALALRPFTLWDEGEVQRAAGLAQFPADFHKTEANLALLQTLDERVYVMFDLHNGEPTPGPSPREGR